MVPARGWVRTYVPYRACGTSLRVASAVSGAAFERSRSSRRVRVTVRTLQRPVRQTLAEGAATGADGGSASV